MMTKLPNDAFLRTYPRCQATRICIIKGYENCTLLGYYAANSGISLLTFQGNRLVPSSRVKNPVRRWDRQVVPKHR